MIFYVGTGRVVLAIYRGRQAVRVYAPRSSEMKIEQSCPEIKIRFDVIKVCYQIYNLRFQPT